MIQTARALLGPTDIITIAKLKQLTDRYSNSFCFSAAFATEGNRQVIFSRAFINVDDQQDIISGLTFVRMKCCFVDY